LAPSFCSSPKAENFLGAVGAHAEQLPPPPPFCYKPATPFRQLAPDPTRWFVRPVDTARRMSLENR
jgi:hypothetical protein